MNQIVEVQENRSEAQVQERLQVVRLWFDGGTGPTNPGNGYGSYEIQSEHLNHVVSRAGFGNPITSNQAEYMTLLLALNWLGHNAEKAQTQLLIFSDSKLVVMQVSGSWKVKCFHIRELRDEVRALLACFQKWEIHWQSRVENIKRFGH